MSKFRAAMAATLLFLFLLIGAYVTHVWWFTVNVVFYSALIDVVIACMIAGLILSWARLFAELGSFEKLQLVMIWVLIGYALAISIPTVIDRSLSFYILEKLQQRGGGIRQEAFEQVFTREYVKEHHLVDVRLTEQLQSGSIVIEGGCVKLTTWGTLIASGSRDFRQHFLPKRRLLLGEYSDALVDPFKNSSDSVGYECK